MADGGDEEIRREALFKPLDDITATPCRKRALLAVRLEVGPVVALLEKAR